MFRPQCTTDVSCPPGETPGESPQEMSDRVDRVIAKIRKLHADAETASPDEVNWSDVIIFSHGHFTRSFIARWCTFPIAAGYNFSADAGGVSGLAWRDTDGSLLFLGTSTTRSRSLVSGNGRRVADVTSAFGFELVHRVPPQASQVVRVEQVENAEVALRCCPLRPARETDETWTDQIDLKCGAVDRYQITLIYSRLEKLALWTMTDGEHKGQRR